MGIFSLAAALACITGVLGAAKGQTVANTPMVQAPTRVAEVTVYSDRARVLRRTSIEVGGGMNTVDLGELPTNAFAETVRVSADGGAVRRVEVEVVPSLGTRLSRQEVDQLIEKLEALRDEAALLTREVQVVDRELALLASTHPQPVPEEAKRLDAKVSMSAASEQWGKVLDFVEARMTAARKVRRELAAKQESVGEKLAKLAAEASRRGLDTSVRTAPRVRAVLEPARAGRVTLELEYFVAQASWHPRYDVHFDAKSGTAKLLTSASVTQRSGEDWDEAKLSFSTAMPGQGVELPELLTWTIGEQRDFLPVARPAPGQAPPSRFPPPALVVATSLDASQLELQERVQRLAGLAEPSVGLGQSNNSAQGASAAPMAPPPPRPMKARPVPNAAPSGAPADALQMDAGYAREMAAPEPSAAPSSKRRTAAADKPAPAGMALGLDEPPARPRLTDPSLPAVAAGGLDYVWSAATASSIASTGEAVDVPLDAQHYPVKPTYEATPALEKVAFLHAAVANHGQRPLLTGQLSVFASGVFIAESALETTGPGATIELPLGADQDVRLERRLVPRTKTKGLISKDEVTRYELEIDVANYKRQAVRVRVSDQIPTTNTQSVRIELKDMSPTPSEGPDPRGMIHWDVDVAPGKTKTIRLTYEITRPADWRLWQM
ncbi:MAG: mucoidy inhibitor MuiA family protein [Myxococcota bacterium]